MRDGERRARIAGPVHRPAPLDAAADQWCRVPERRLRTRLRLRAGTTDGAATALHAMVSLRWTALSGPPMPRRTGISSRSCFASPSGAGQQPPELGRTLGERLTASRPGLPPVAAQRWERVRRCCRGHRRGKTSASAALSPLRRRCRPINLVCGGLEGDVVGACSECSLRVRHRHGRGAWRFDWQRRNSGNRGCRR